MSFWNKKESPDSAKENQQTSTPSGNSKGRPTPKRKEAQKRNERPLVVNKKEARRRQRAKRDEFYRKQQEAMLGKGDERYLPVQDQGPLKRYVRDYLDSRFCIAEIFMPIVIAFMIISLMFRSNAQVNNYMLLAMWALFLVGFLDASLTTYLINRKTVALFAGNKSIKRGIGRYVVMRAMVPRPLRRPKPLVSLGKRPDLADYASDIRRYYLR